MTSGSSTPRTEGDAVAPLPSRASQDAPASAAPAARVRGSGAHNASNGSRGAPPAFHGGLPDSGALVALEDIATGRLYVVTENQDGSMYLELSDVPAGDLANHEARVRLAFRRTVRAVSPYSLSLGPLK